MRPPFPGRGLSSRGPYLAVATIVWLWYGTVNTAPLFFRLFTTSRHTRTIMTTTATELRTGPAIQTGVPVPRVAAGAGGAVAAGTVNESAVVGIVEEVEELT